MIRLLRSILLGISAVRIMSGSELFDRAYYAKKYHVPKFLSVWYDVLIGRRFLNDPSEEFSAKKYAERYPDIKNSRMPALYHYLKFGKKEGRIYESTVSEINHCPLLELFDRAWYTKTYSRELAEDAKEARSHYLTVGWKQGLKPFDNFDAERFWHENPECREEPLTYWYKNRLPVLYFRDVSETVLDEDPKKRRVMQFLFHYVQDAAIKQLIPEDHAGKDLTICFAPDYGEGNMSALFTFQTRMEDILANRRKDEIIIAATRPGTATYSGEGVFSEDICILRYGQISFQLYGWSTVTLCVADVQLAAALEYLKYNPEDPINYCPDKTLRILDYGQVGDLQSLTKQAASIFKTVTTEYATPVNPYDNPYRGFFDERWYTKTYLSEKNKTITKDPYRHYLLAGWRAHCKPFRCFDIDAFYADHPTCSIEPLLYLYHKRIPQYYFTEKSIPKMQLDQDAGRAMQALYRIRQEAQADRILPYDNTIERIMLILVSPEDAISGGIMSFYGIYHLSRKMSGIHGRTVIAATIPGDTTHAGFTMFKNDMPVLRYDLVMRRIHHVRDVLLMVPEIYVQPYLKYLSENTEDPLFQAERRQLNIMNQKIEIMPEPDVIEEMKLYFPHITQTVAHYKYCTQHERDYYGIPMHLLLPPIIKEFTLLPYEKKENIFAYSYDEQPWKKKLLEALKAAFPELVFTEIKGMSFDEYLGLIHRAKWCMTFGEGLDGYFSEPYQAGGISFAVWNDAYFTERYKNLPTVLPSADTVAEDLTARMRQLDNKEEYERVSALVREVHGQEYANGRTSEDQLLDFFENRLDYP